ncbi:MAG: hypothetical protein PHS06_02015 [Candidatus Shapirobacteria bacterium]|nr:hypothetical protein [Candidatus Shapirobacteria bacterium]
MSEPKDPDELLTSETEGKQAKPKKWWRIIGIAALIAIIALMLWQNQPWSKETTVNGDLHVKGNLVVDKNAEIKDTITAKKVVALEEIQTPIIKANVGEIAHVKANVVDAVTVNADTVNANTANIQVVNAGKVNTGSNIPSVTVQPVQSVDQTGSANTASTGSENSFTSGDPQWNTGVGITKTVTLNVSPGKTAVVGGYTVNGVKGLLKIYQPGTYQLTICDGFIRDNIDPANSQSTYQMKKDEAQRLGQDISNAQN